MESQLETLLFQAKALESSVQTMLQENHEMEEERKLLSQASVLFDSGDTAWMMFATILVYMMTLPGIMLYYAGFVRVQNVLSTAMQGFSLACLITFLWLCFGYSLAFSPTNSTNPETRVFGTAERFWLLGMHPDSAHQLASTIPEPLFCAYQLAFAIITPSLICGAFADRMKFSSMLLSLGLWHLVVYCPIAHSHWHPDGFLNRADILDFAGGNVVHVSAGFSSLVSAIIIGQRSGFGKNNFHPHNLLVSITGACFLWTGWYGFNAGSGLKSNEQAGIAMLNTMIASAVASMAWMSVDLLLTGRASIIGIMNGAIAGLVAITPAAGFVSQTGAFCIGVVGGVAVSRGVLIKDILKFDDALDAFGVHAIGGLIGSLMVGLFAKEEIGGTNGAFYGNPKQLGLQLYGIVFTVGWACVGTLLVMLFVDNLVGLRVSKSKEGDLDRSLHGSAMYSSLALVPDRKKEYEEDRKKMTLMRRFKDKKTANDNALDFVDEREERERSRANRKNIEMTEGVAAGGGGGVTSGGERNNGPVPNPQGGEEPGSMEDVALEETTYGQVQNPETVEEI